MKRARKAPREDLLCHHCDIYCGFGDDYYMVKDEVWFDEAKLAWDDFLCRGCLMSILGRELVFEDYTHAPVNWDILMTEFNFKPDNYVPYDHRLPDWGA